MKRTLSLMFAGLVVVMLFGAFGYYASAQQDQTSIPSQNDVQTVAPDQIDGLIDNIAAGLSVVWKTRIVQLGQIVQSESTDGIVIDRSGATFDPVARTIMVFGKFGGQNVVEDVRVYTTEQTAYVARDIYLNPAEDLFLGRSIPIDLSSRKTERTTSSFANQPEMMTATVVSTPSPTISSIGGITNDSAGIKNGLVSMTCGAAYNGGRVVNDQSGVYPWTINGANFGTKPGSVTLGGGITTTVQSWSPTTIVIQPVVPYSAAPMSVLLSIKTATGVTGTFGASVVPSVRSRIFTQCTWWVACSRLNLGKLPSPTAYGGYSAITSQWVPQVGDQLQWNAAHTAIISKVQDSGPQAGIRTWTLTITEYNSKCTNAFNSYTTTFVIRTANGVIVSYPQSSIKSFGSATVFYR